MGRLLRQILFIALTLVSLARVFTHHGAPSANAAAQENVARVDAGGDAAEPYNPWGATKKDPVTDRALEPKVLVRDASGQFHVNVAINGHDTRFLVDTGADLVALTPRTADDLGLRIAPDDYRPVLRTASGTGMGAVVTLDSVEVTGRRLTHQRAVVAQGLDENLLGQSVLRNLGRVELKGDTMVLMPN